MEEFNPREFACCSACAPACSGVVPGTQRRAHREGRSGAQGPFFVTPHAVERYRERVHRGISYERALREIVDVCRRAHYVKDYHGGAMYWRGPKPMRLRLLVAPSVNGELPQVMTILPAADNMRPK